MPDESQTMEELDINEEEDKEIPLEEVLKDIKVSQYEDYKQLVYLGKISDTYEALGHKFRVHSMTAEEEIKLTSFLFKYRDAITYSKAMWIECLAYVIDEVDGEPLVPLALEGGEAFVDKMIEAKRKEIMKWSPTVINELYNIIYLDLRARERAVVAQVKKSHRAGKSVIFSGSQNEEESFQDQPMTQDSL